VAVLHQQIMVAVAVAVAVKDVLMVHVAELAMAVLEVVEPQ
jgi:hypothetical protein